MNPLPNDDSKLRSAIIRAIENQTSDEKERLIRAAVAEFEVAVRKAVGRVAIDISKMYSIVSHGQEMVIRVNLEGLSPQAPKET